LVKFSHIHLETTVRLSKGATGDMNPGPKEEVNARDMNWGLNSKAFVVWVWM
jgi:hypothetical protein